MTTASESSQHTSSSGRPLAALRRFVRASPLPIRATHHCELCGEPIGREHRHLLELRQRRLLCACNACALLFEQEGAGAGTYRTVPDRYLVLRDFVMTDGEWDELMIPVNMAFLVRSSGTVSAYYPGPAGATESLLSLRQWETLTRNNVPLQGMDDDVEALLIQRVRGARAYYIVPIDACYQLVGLIRSTWRGFSGGETAWQAIETFFASIQARAVIVEAAARMKEDGHARAEL